MQDTEAATPPVADTPRRRGRPRKTDASDSGRRLALIAAAARQFRDKGFDATTTRDIASATGMQSGSPFYHFKSKSDLLFAVMEEGMLAAQRSQDAVLAALPPATSARDTLGALVLNHLYVLWLPGNDFVPVMHYEWRALTPAQHARIQALKDAYELPWQAALAQLADEGRLGTDASLARSMLFGVLHGTLRWFKPKGKLKLEQLARECLNAMVAEWPHGTAAPKAARNTETAEPPAFDPVPLVRRVWRGRSGMRSVTPSWPPGR
jgi:AcrR family transcriptional regulator